MPRTYSSTMPHTNPRNMTYSRPMPYNKLSGHEHDHDRHGHHRHDRDFFGFGFVGYGYDDYAYYDTCWQLVPTAYGWQRVWTCGYQYGYGW